MWEADVTPWRLSTSPPLHLSICPSVHVASSTKQFTANANLMACWRPLHAACHLPRRAHTHRCAHSCAPSPQTSQGVQPKRFKRLPELVSLYLQPNQGLVTTLLYAVDREETVFTDEKDYSGNREACMDEFTAHSFFFFMLAFFYFVIRWGG